jgi:nucleotide-binding universal stress UspA family protein
MYKKVLLAVDGSDNAKRAAQKVIEIKKAADCEVIAFFSTRHRMIPPKIPTAVPIGNTYNYSIPTEAYNEIRDAYINRGKTILNETKKLFEEENLSIATRLIKDENPAKYIERAVKEEEFDLVALGCKGEHSKVEELLLGTVSEKVLNKAPCDVLIVR